MATDCEKFSDNAQKIFEKLQPFFPLDPWQEPQWTAAGKVRPLASTWYDLRKSSDRRRLEKETITKLGQFAQIQAHIHKEECGSLKGFTHRCFPRSMQNIAELLLILEELDFQIETLDIVESC